MTYHRITSEDSKDLLRVEDVLDVQEYGVVELKNQNISTREALKELYKIQLYLYEANKLKYEPCPICIVGYIKSNSAKRKCRGCGSFSCLRCCQYKWHFLPNSKGEDYVRSSDDKRCSLCHPEENALN